MPPPKTIAEKYKKKDLRSHIYDLPDTYIGGCDPATTELYVYDDDQQNMVKRSITYVPGFYKIYDELVTNTTDHATRLKLEAKEDSKPLKVIKISIDKDTGIVEVYNDGDSIEVEKHPDHNMYVPHLVFGNLLTSANYDKNEEKLGSGKNGVGAKCCNIFSKLFTVELVDHRNKKKYVQHFRENMTQYDEPIITSSGKSAPYTKIRFLPDYRRFGLEGLTDDIYALFRKRAIDITGCTDSNVAVYFNDEKLQCKSFQEYVNLFIPKGQPIVYEQCGDRWEVAVTYSPNHQFEQISFCNGISTFRGGKHLDHVTTQIVKRLGEMIQSKKKKEVKAQHIKENLMVFVKALIVNPSFDSQTKEYVTTKVTDFGSKCELSDKFFDKLYKTDLVNRVVNLTEFHDTKKLTKTDGKKTSRVIIPNFEDAIQAGSKDSAECTLMIVEGLSAKTLAVSGMSVIGRERFGVFPLKGKVMNIRDMSTDRIANNQEIAYLKKILGLETGKEYKDLSSLRYGKIMIITDADDDGVHIRGLLFNLFQALWPSLFKMDGFLTSLLTPVVKAFHKQKKQTLSFYSSADFENWRQNTDQSGWVTKYYKGLGSSKEDEAKQYFREMNKITYIYNGKQSEDCMDLAFNKKRADDRKQWLMKYQRDITINYEDREIPYEDFVHKELIHYSNRDVERSIPNVCDGMKESLRKILYTCFKRKLYTSEIRVAQLAGSVSELTAYHHGEASLQNAIIGMAQTFVGSNNINLLQPNGQFGSRQASGQDAASPRYIYTLLSPLARAIFREEDHCILKYLYDDEVPIEPQYYIPILPMILVNGCIGIATGFSTNIPCYNPSDLIQWCRTVMQGLDKEFGNIQELGINGDETSRVYDFIHSCPLSTIHPWYLGFKGTITLDDDNVYASKGIYEWTDDTTVEITELPLNVWTDNYKEMLDKMLADGHTYLKDYENHSTTKNVRFVLKFTATAKKHYTDAKFETEFKLTSRKQLSVRNQHLYNANGQIQRYHEIADIFREWACVRLTAYQKRKAHQIAEMEKEYQVLSAKVRFIREIIANEVHVMNRPQKDVVQQLKDREYPTDPYASQQEEETTTNNPYQYLVKMPIYQLTQEKKEQLEKEAADLNTRMENLRGTRIQHIWRDEIAHLEKLWNAHRDAILEEYKEDLETAKDASKGGPRKRKAPAKKK